MSIEKAMAILKVPCGRTVNISDKPLVDDCFKSMLFDRVKISSDDAHYERKVENRYVLESKLSLYET